MSSGDLATIIGLGGTLIGIIVAIVAQYRATADKIQKGDDALHDRINRVRDEYVRRIDLDGHLARLDTSVKELREETREGTRETNRRLDQVLAALAPASRRSTS